MSAIGNLVIQDGAGSPVTHTFYPIQSGQLSLFRENQAGLPIVGQGVISVAVKADQKGGLNKVRVSMDLPALETATGANSAGYTAAPKVAYSNKVTMEFFLPSRGTAAQRKDLRVLIADLMTEALLIDAIENINVPY
jgi:hypothetical protein